MANLSVNVNKIATLRNSRGGGAPDLMAFVGHIVAFGAPVDPKAFENRDALMAEVRTRIEALRERALQL